MAIMIPSEAREYDERSLEGIMFEALKKMSDDFFVIHSFRNTYVADNVLSESETDFVVFNRFLGILCIEAKAGQVHYLDGKWLYANGDEISHDGPYVQATKNKHNLMERLDFSPLCDLKRHCKFMHAVWFPSIDRKKLFTNQFPAEFAREITLTKEDLLNPEESIVNIMKLQVKGNPKTDLTEEDTKRFLREIICPEAHIFPSANFYNDLKKITFNRLLKEQANVLKYIEDQKTAVINGAAGTGKTMIAVEKATSEANKGDKVLFLCYNSKLKEHLDKEYHHVNIDYMTIDGFACKLCATPKADYFAAKEILEEMYYNESFPYKHVIVDEGQDLGKEKIEEANILQVIHDAIVDRDVDGSFYVFYDRLQMVQSETIPEYILNADCKLTLYKNCRNTENIAKTSLKPVAGRKPKLIEGAMIGTPATIHFGNNKEEEISLINNTIQALKKDGMEEIVIITCESEDSSILKGMIKEGKYKKIPFTTCRKFKGLEADAVILIDVSRKTFEEKSVDCFYVGTSRAKLRLDIITSMSDEDCSFVLMEVLKYNKKIKNPKRDFATQMNSLVEI